MSTRYPVIIPLIVGCAQFMHQFDGAVIATALPSMAGSLHEDPLRLNLAITTYLLALAVFVPISGWMADRFGTRRLYLLAIAIFTISSVTCAMSTSLASLVVSRCIQGIGGAMMTPVGRIIVVKTAPRGELVRAMNYITIPGALAPLLGPSIGGFIVTYLSWPWIFLINLPIGVIGLILVYRNIPEIREPEVPDLDLMGFVMSAVAMASLVLGFEAMGRDLLPPTVVVGLLATGIAGASIYVFHARRIANPIIDLNLLKVRTFAATLSGGGLFYMTTTSTVFLLSLMFQLGFGMTAFQAGMTTVAVAVGSVLTRFVFRSVLGFVGFRSLLVVNAAVTTAYLLACGLFQSTTPYVVILMVLFIGGFSRSLQFTAVQSLVYADIPRPMMARATSFSALNQQLAQTLGVGLAALVVNISLHWSSETALSTNDIGRGFFATGIVAFCSTLVFLTLPKDAGKEIHARQS